MCNEWWQEYILLLDVFGVLMLVDVINNCKFFGVFESMVLGFFYVVDVFELLMGVNICFDSKGEDMVIEGCIFDIEGRLIVDVVIDVWQVNDEGFYDVQQKGIQLDFNLCGIFCIGLDGYYWFCVVKLKYYFIFDDGFVGQLFGVFGCYFYWLVYLYYIISVSGFEMFIMYIFDFDDFYIYLDVVFGVKESLLVWFDRVYDLVCVKDYVFFGDFWEVKYDFVLVWSQVV